MPIALADLCLDDTPSIQPDAFFIPDPENGGPVTSYDNSPQTVTTNGQNNNNPRWRTGANRAVNRLISGNEDDDSFSDEDEGSNGNGNGNGNMELEEEPELHYTILVGLLLGTARDDIWLVLNRARDTVREKIENCEFGSTALNVRNGSFVLRCDAKFKAETIAMAGEDNDMEYVLISLEQWLYTMLDMQVQGARISIPWMAGPWAMNWLLFLMQ